MILNVVEQKKKLSCEHYANAFFLPFYFRLDKLNILESKGEIELIFFRALPTITFGLLCFGDWFLSLPLVGGNY